MTDLSLVTYRAIASPETRENFRVSMESAGYFAFYAFVEDFRDLLKSYTESDAPEVGTLLAHARGDFPNPGRFSPSWDKIWDGFDGIYGAKNDTLEQFAPSDRDGEWQVLLDNPNLPLQVVCYPGLTFADAVYMFAYFQKDLKPSEFLRLQKVARLLVVNGNKEASIFPDR